MTIELCAFATFYAAWFVATVAVLPVLLSCGLRAPQAWVTARVVGPALIALVTLHLARWLGIGLGPSVVGTCGVAFLANLVLLHKWRHVIRSLRRRSFRAFALRTETILLAATLLLIALF